MNVAELKTQLQDLLLPELGSYTNGLKSVWVYGSAQDPPSVSNGLECLIRQVPSGAARGSSAGQRFKPQEWEVVLKNFKRDSNLVKALRKIEVRYVVLRYSHIPFSNEFFESARIVIFDPIFINV